MIGEYGSECIIIIRVLGSPDSLLIYGSKE